MAALVADSIKLRGHNARYWPVIYVLAPVGTTKVVKVGRSSNWLQRRKAYDGAIGGIEKAHVFELADDARRLPAIEAAVLGEIYYPKLRGAEWFRADLEDVVVAVRLALQRAGVPYEEVVER